MGPYIREIASYGRSEWAGERTFDIFAFAFLEQGARRIKIPTGVQGRSR